jgi:hypothetical protein
VLKQTLSERDYQLNLSRRKHFIEQTQLMKYKHSKHQIKMHHSSFPEQSSWGKNELFNQSHRLERNEALETL